VLQGTLDHVAPAEGDTTHVTIRSKTWSRWRGTPDDLLRIVEVAREEISKRTQQSPSVSIQVAIGGKGDREQYFDVESFRRDIQAQDAGSPGGRLAQIQQLQISVGGSGQGGYLVNVGLSRGLPAPGIALTAEGADRTVVGGLREVLSQVIETGKPRIPALNGPAAMLFGGVVGLLYYLGMASVEWDFLPNGVFGYILFGLLYLSGFIAVLYAYTAIQSLLMPPIVLTHPGQQTEPQKWLPKIKKIAGALALAVLPFLLEQFFSK
jgi:hypothetical protein